MRSKKVYNNIYDIAEIFVKGDKPEAMTPLCNILNRGKGRRFWFKGNIAYSYSDSFPLARKEGNTIFVKDFCPSNTTKKHKSTIVDKAIYYDMVIIFSDDLKTPISIDRYIERELKRLLNMRKKIVYGVNTVLIDLLSSKKYPVTKSKFPLLFDKEHEKLKEMLLSDDYEIFNLARKIIKQKKLV